MRNTNKNEVTEEAKIKNSEASQEVKQKDQVLEKLLKEVEVLKAKDIENQKQLKMLYEVADKGRVFNYEAHRAEKKPTTVKLSVYNGSIIIGWRTIKDELIKHPTTGLIVGETQEYELLLMGKEGGIIKSSIAGYPAFSNARYTEQIDCVVIGRKEDWNGTTTLSLGLPDGRTIDLDARYCN